MEKPRALPVLNGDGEPAGPGRRQVLQGLLAGVGAAIPGATAIPGHVAHAAAAPPAPRVKAADWRPEFLDAHQFATLTLLCEQIVPGSTKVQSDRFLDAALAVETRENKQRFLSAMGAIDAEAGRRHGKPFRSLPEAARVEILTAAASGAPGRPDWTWEPGTPVVRPEDGPSETTLRDHFDTLKRTIAGAYYSSEAGLKELGFTGNQFFPTFPDCDHEGGHSG
jgi:hypothetical protein